MNVWYVTMQFPAPSETFAGVEVRALRNTGVNLTIHSLRTAGDNCQSLLGDWGIDDVTVTMTTSRRVLIGILLCLVQPFKVLAFLSWVTLRTWKNPRAFLKSIILTPRIFDLLSGFRQDRPDVVHLFWGHYPALFGYMVKKYYPEVVLSMFLGAYDLERRYGYSADTANAADMVWTHAKSNLSKIEALNIEKNKIRVNYRGIDVREVTDQKTQKVRNRIITAGRLIKPKRMDRVIESFAGVYAHCPDATLTILGDGPERENLESLSSALGVKHAVNIMGYIPHRLVYREFLKSEVFLFLSDSQSERLPNVVKEAMVCKCLCLVSATEGIDELIKDGLNGYIVPDDLDAISSRIKTILLNHDERLDMVENAHKTVCENFDVEKNIQSYISAWQDLVPRKMY